MKKVPHDILRYFERRPQSKLALIRLLVYVMFAVFLKTALDMDTIILYLSLVWGLGDLGLTEVGNAQTTPLDDPKLGAGKTIPPALEVAAAAVADYLPAPLGELFKRYGAEGTWAIVKTAEEAAKHKPTLDEGKAKAGAI